MQTETNPNEVRVFDDPSLTLDAYDYQSLHKTLARLMSAASVMETGADNLRRDCRRTLTDLYSAVSLIESELVRLQDKHKLDKDLVPYIIHTDEQPNAGDL
jgi:hypothetical protein